MPVRAQRAYSVSEMLNWPRLFVNSWFPMRSQRFPNATAILRNQAQDLVPVMGVEVRVFSSASVMAAILSLLARCQMW